MKKLLLLLISMYTTQAGFFNILTPSSDKQTIIVSTDAAEKRERLKLLLDERAELESKEKDTSALLQKEIEQLNDRIKQKEHNLLERTFPSEKKHLQEAVALLQEIKQYTHEISITQQSIKSLTDQEIALIEDYLKDPNFESLTIESQTYFSYENLYNLLQQVLGLEESITQSQEEKNNTEADLEAKKRDLANLEKDLKEKEKEQKKFMSSDGVREDSPLKAELIDLNRDVVQAKKRLLEKKIRELSLRQYLLTTKLFIAQSKLTILKSNLKIVERRLRVYEKDIHQATKKLAAIKKEVNDQQIAYNQQIQELSDQKNTVEKEIKDIIAKLELSQDAITSVINWTMQTKNIPIDREVTYYRLGSLLDKELEIDLLIELYKTQKEEGQHKILHQDIERNILSTWQQLTLNKISTSETLSALVSMFDTYKKELNRDMLYFKEKISTISSSTHKQTKELELVKEKQRSLVEREKLISKAAFEESARYLQDAEKSILEEMRINSDLIKIYSGMISSQKDLEKQISLLLFMLEKLGGSVLFRSEYAISLKSIQSIIPEVRSFLSDVKNILKTAPKKLLQTKPHDLITLAYSNVLELIEWIGLLLVVMLLFILLRHALPYGARLLLNLQTGSKILTFVYELMGASLLFIAQKLILIFPWFTLFSFVWFGLISNIEFTVIFYLISIPYLLYIAYTYLNFILVFNREHNYSLISEHFQYRFYLVLLFLGIATVTIFFFKEAFLTATYAKRQLPTILDALYSIILRACLIFLIGREEILSLIPETDEFWLWVRKQVYRLYYPILLIILGIIIVSDPYIGGFGKLVSYVLWGITGTILLIGTLSWLQGKVRTLSASLFFEIEDETARQERFSYAKLLYGIFIIATFILFIVLAIYIGSKIWGRPVSFETITNFLNIKVFSTLGENNQYIPITVGSLLTVVGFILGGIGIAWLFEHFLLARLFHILLIDVGIQNTIASISSYIIFLIAIVIGLMRIGVSGTTMSYFLGALAVALAFAVKGPANDFIGYFILLVERSLKIGDYVEFHTSGNTPIAGVVRKITPRTIVLRRNNSFTTLVPNSTVITSTFYNWNYTNTFFAFDDIIITVTYDSDPAKAKEVLLQILDKHKDVLKSPSPIVRLENFNEAGFVFLVRGFLSSINVLKRWDIASDIRLSIVRSLREQGIKLAVPVRYIVAKPDEEKIEIGMK